MSMIKNYSLLRNNYKVVLSRYNSGCILYGMDTIQNKEAALLGLLAESPMHAYQIEKTVEHRDMRSWTDLSMSTIYKTLRSLEGRELVTKELKINEKNVAQKLYRISEKGLEALRSRFFEMLTIVEPQKWQIDIVLYNLPVLTPEEAIESLQKYIGNLIQCVSQYRALEKYLQESRCQSYVQSVAIRPQFLLKADIEWANDFIKRIEQDGDSWTQKK